MLFTTKINNPITKNNNTERTISMNLNAKPTLINDTGSIQLPVSNNRQPTMLGSVDMGNSIYTNTKEPSRFNNLLLETQKKYENESLPPPQSNPFSPTPPQTPPAPPQPQSPTPKPQSPPPQIKREHNTDIKIISSLENTIIAENIKMVFEENNRNTEIIYTTTIPNDTHEMTKFFVMNIEEITNLDEVSPERCVIYQTKHASILEEKAILFMKGCKQVFESDVNNNRFYPEQIKNRLSIVRPIIKPRSIDKNNRLIDVVFIGDMDKSDNREQLKRNIITKLIKYNLDAGKKYNFKMFNKDSFDEYIPYLKETSLVIIIDKTEDSLSDIFRIASILSLGCCVLCEKQEQQFNLEDTKQITYFQDVDNMMVMLGGLVERDANIQERLDFTEEYNKDFIELLTRL